MSKYMIEIEDVPFSKVRIDADNGAQNINLYRVKGFNALVFDKNGLDKLTPLDEALEEAYQKGYDTGSHESTTLEYQRGLDDAWETAKYLFSEMSNTEINLVFPQEWNNGGFKALMALDPKDAIDRINAFERKQKPDEIKVGDEVTPKSNDSNWLGVVVGVDDTNAMVMTRDGYTAMYRIEILKKIGRHFPQMAELLEAMKDSEVTE